MDFSPTALAAAVRSAASNPSAKPSALTPPLATASATDRHALQAPLLHGLEDALAFLAGKIVARCAIIHLKSSHTSSPLKISLKIPTLHFKRDVSRCQSFYSTTGVLRVKLLIGARGLPLIPATHRQHRTCDIGSLVRRQKKYGIGLLFR